VPKVEEPKLGQRPRWGVFMSRTLFTLGALALTAGLALTGIAAWTMFGAENQAATSQQALAEAVPLIETLPAETSAPVSAIEPGEVFAKFRAPRLGADYVRQIAEGTGMEEVLNTVGVGRYLSSALPGEVGNVALAAHRSGNGGPFRNIDKFESGDLVYIETADAAYTYRYLQTKVVSPDAIGVIAASPEGLTATTASDKFLTLTTCTPIYINTERLIVWFEQISVDSK
jgi:sortase A